MYFQKQRNIILSNITRQNHWISPITIQALKIYQKTFQKSPSFSIDLRLQNNYPFLQLNPLFEYVDVVNLVTVPISSLFLVTLYLLYTSTDTLSTRAVMQAVTMFCVLTIFIFSGIIRHIIRKNQEYASQRNALLQYNTTLLSEDLDRKKGGINDGCFDLVALLLFLLIILFNVMGIPSYAILCYIGMDPVQAALQLCLNTPPSNLTFLFSTIICNLLIMFICAREIYVFVFVGMVLLDRIKVELVALNSYNLMETEFVSNRYILLRRQHLRLEKVFSLGTASAVVFVKIIQWAFMWMACSCWMLIPAYMSATGVVISILTLVLVSLALGTESYCQVSSQNLLAKHLDGFHVYGIKCRKNGYVKRIWNCQLPLRIFCGRQFVVGGDAFMNYMDVLSSNLTNAVCIIKNLGHFPLWCFCKLSDTK